MLAVEGDDEDEMEGEKEDEMEGEEEDEMEDGDEMWREKKGVVKKEMEDG